jgi:hypothetical protein
MTNTNDTKGIDVNDAATRVADDAAAGCCGGPAPSNANACCSRDEAIKASGGAGCGCDRGGTASKKSCC